MTIFQYYLCFKGIVFRESLRFFYQRERFFAALVRPLVWLAIFAVGFRSFLGVSRPLGQPENWPYPISLVPYELYIAAGLIAMIQLFNGMQSSLSMVYDREMGSMRTLLVSPFFINFKISSWGFCKRTPGFCIFNYCFILGYRATNNWLFMSFTRSFFIRNDARSIRNVFIFSN